MGADSRSGDAAPSISSHVFTRFRPSKKREESKQKWETLKDHIYKLYVAEEKTLRETMVEIEEKHGLKASERKWKKQVDQWKFNKYISREDMAVIIAKGEKRSREEGKETTFYHNGLRLAEEKIQNFKKRRTASMIEAVCLLRHSATPENITYNTPEHQNNSSGTVSEEEIEKEMVVSAATGNVPMSPNRAQNGVPSPMLEEEDYGLKEILMPYMTPLQASGAVFAGRPCNRELASEWLEDVVKRYPLFAVEVEDQPPLWERKWELLSQLRELTSDSTRLSEDAVVNLFFDYVDRFRAEKGLLHPFMCHLAYIAIIVVYCELPNYNKKFLEESAREFLDDFGDTFSIYEQSISTYHQLLILFMKTFGQSARVTLRASYIFANALAITPTTRAIEFTEVEALYNFAAGGFRRLKVAEELLKCQLSYGQLLLDIGLPKESADVLASSTSQFLELNYRGRMVSTGSAKPSSIFSALSPVGSRPSWIEGDEMYSFLKEVVRMTTSKMEQIMDQKLETQGILFNQNRAAIEMTKQVAKLGAELALLSWSLKSSHAVAYQPILSAAESITQNIMPILEDLPGAAWFDKAYCYIQLGIFYFRMRSWEIFVCNMEKAYKLIKECYTPAQNDLLYLFIATRASILPTGILGSSLFRRFLDMDLDKELISRLAHPEPQQTSEEIEAENFNRALTLSSGSHGNSTSKFSRIKTAVSRSSANRSAGTRSTGTRSDWSRSVGSKGVTYSEGSVSGLDIPYRDLGI